MGHAVNAAKKWVRCMTCDGRQLLDTADFEVESSCTGCWARILQATWLEHFVYHCQKRGWLTRLLLAFEQPHPGWQSHDALLLQPPPSCQ